ncbi:MAG TPA: hypothetical protein VGL92_05195 [Acidimicrobiia bacterium]|jgi:hypothetical protein
MRRALALSWALGTSTGVLLGLSGVQLVTSGITGERIAPLSRPEVLQALSAGNTKEAPEAIAAPAITAPPASTDIGSAPPLPDPVSKPARTPPASAPPRPGAPAGPTSTTTAPPPPTTSAPPPAPVIASPPPPDTTTTTAPKGETRTISSRGGTVAVRYLDGTVRLLWARPDSGYDVEVADDGPDQVLVRFRSDRARSWVYAYYEDGKPAEAVIERGGGKGNDNDPRPKGSEPVRQQSSWGDANR